MRRGAFPAFLTRHRSRRTDGTRADDDSARSVRVRTRGKNIHHLRRRRERPATCVRAYVRTAQLRKIRRDERTDGRSVGHGAEVVRRRRPTRGTTWRGRAMTPHRRIRAYTVVPSLFGPPESVVNVSKRLRGLRVTSGGGEG